MAIKYEVTVDNKGFVEGMHQVQESVRQTNRQVEQAFEEQAKVVENLTTRMKELEAEMDKAEKAGDTQKLAEKRKEHEKLTEELQKEKQSFVELNKEFGKGGGGMEAQGKSTQSLREKMRLLTQELTELTLKYRSMSEAEQQSARGQEMLQKIERLTNEAGTLRDAMADVNRTVSGVASDTRNWDALGQGINVATSAFGGLVGAASLFGAKEEELQQLQTKLQASLAISNALSVIQNNLQKESALMMGIAQIQTKALAAATDIDTAAKGRNIVVTKAAAAAQAVLNAVAKANPYVLLATAILTVVGALAALHIGSKRAKESQEELAKAEEEAAAKAKEARDAFVSASAEAMNTASRISNMQVAYKKANTEMEKTQILKEAQKQFKALGLECNSLVDAQRLLVNQGGKVIEMLRLQGTVAALSAMRMEAFKKSFSAIYENNGDAGYAAGLAGYNEQVLELDAQIAKYQGRIGAIQSSLPMARSGGGSVRTTKSGGTSGSGSKVVTEAERKAMAERRKREAALEARDLELSTEEARIKAMDEGTDKVVRQIWLDYYREQLAIEKTQASLRQKRIDEAKKTWDADPKTKDKDFFASEAYTMAYADTAETMRNKSEREEAALMERERRLKENADVEDAAMREYLIKYGEYQQKRLAITEKYKALIDKAMTQGEKMMLEKQREEELDNLDKEIMESSKLWSDFFGKFESRSNSAIRGIMKDIQQLIDYMNGVEGVEMPDIFKSNEEAVKSIQAALQDPKATKAFVDNLTKTWNTFKKLIDADNPFKNIAEGFKTGDNEGMAKGFKQIADAVGQVNQLMSGLGISSESTTGKVTSMIGNTASLAAQGAQIGGVWGAAAGAALGLAQGAIAMFGADYSQYEKMVEEYTHLIDVWDELIDKKREYISESYGMEAYQAGQEAERLVANELEAWRQLGRERTAAGASAGSHSIGRRVRARMNNEDWAGVQRALGTTDLGGRLEKLYDLSSEQLQKLKEESPTFWAKLDDDMRNYLQKIIDGAEQLEDIQDSVRQQLTNTTFDSVYDSFRSSLSDMDKSAYDFSRDFEKYMFDAMLNTKLDELFKERIENWYKAFAEANKDSNIDASEMAALRNEWEAIGREGMAMRDELRDITGYGSSSEGQATYNAAKSFTQEQGDILNGRLTAIQMNVRENNALAAQIVASLKSMEALTTNSSTTSTAVLEIRNMMVSTNSYLETVARYSKATYTEVADKLDTITQKVREL